MEEVTGVVTAVGVAVVTAVGVAAAMVVGMEVTGGMDTTVDGMEVVEITTSGTSP